MPEGVAGVLTYLAGAGGFSGLVVSLGTLYLQHAQQKLQSEDGINKLVDKKTQDLIARYDTDIQALRDHVGKIQAALDEERTLRRGAEDETREIRRKRDEDLAALREENERLIAETRTLCVTRADQTQAATRDLQRRLNEMEREYQDCRERLAHFERTLPRGDMPVE